MTSTNEMCQATGLRIYSEAVKDVEVHYKGETVATYKAKPKAHAFVEGAYWAMQQRGGVAASSPAVKGSSDS